MGVGMNEASLDRLERLEEDLARGVSLRQFAFDEGIKLASLQRWLYRIERHDLASGTRRDRRTHPCPDCQRLIEPRSERCRACYAKHVQATRRRCTMCGAPTFGVKTNLCRPCYDLSVAKGPHYCVDCSGPVQFHAAQRCRACEDARRARVRDEQAQAEIRRWLQEGLA